MNSGDSFSSTIAATNSNLTRLSKVVGTTTALMVSSSPYGADLTHSQYHEALTDIAKRPAFQKRMFSFTRKSKDASQVAATTSKKPAAIANIRGVDIPDELLRDLPCPANTFSLFQGFEAVQELTKTENEAKKLLRGESPIVVRRRKIAEAAKSGQLSTQQLIKERGELDHRLDLLEVRKELAANEISEIDQRIEHLKSMRGVVFDRVAELEREELELEGLLEQMSVQIEEASDAKEVEVEGGNSQDLDGDGASHSPKASIAGTGGTAGTAAPTTSSDPSSTPESSANSLERVPEELGGKITRLPMHRTDSNGSPIGSRRNSSRKSRPTLQQYYQQGNKISNFRAHDESITQLDFDIPFGTMVSASLDCDAKVWDLARSKEIAVLKGHNASIRCLQMEDNIVVTGSTDATAKVWDLSRIDEDPLVDSLDAHRDELTALYFYDNTLVTGSDDKTLRQWDLNTGRCVQTMDVLWASMLTNSTGSSVHIDPSRAQSMSSTSEHPFVGALQCYDAALATGTADGIARLWDLRTGQVHRQLLGHNGAITCLEFDTTYLVTGSTDKNVRIWDLRMGTISDAFAYESPITSLHFDPRRIVSTNTENTVKIYDRENGKHWSCGPGVQDPEASIVTYASLREGYLIEGRADGIIGTWAC